MSELAGCSNKGLKRKIDGLVRFAAEFDFRNPSNKCLQEKLAPPKNNFWTKPSCEVRELIFQHFNFDDVIKASNVSKIWYDMIAASSCMSQIQINVGKNDLNELDLKQSRRKYSKLKLHSFSESIVEYLTKHSWYKVSMLIGSLTDVQCSQLLLIFAPNICEFEIYIENVVVSERDAMSPIDFPLLHTATFRWTSKKIFEPFAGANNNNLKNVVIELSKGDNHESVKTLFRQNKSITNISIRLTADDYNNLFSEDFSPSLRLRLETLSFYWRNTNFVERAKIDNLKKFFLSQKNCLKRFVFECTFDCKSALELIVNEMRTLEHLTLVDLDDETLLLSDKKDFNLRINPSIKQIDVCVNWFVSSRMFTQLILASPNLEVLYIFELSARTMKFLAKNTRNLRHLIYEEIDNDCEVFYNNMITIHRDGDINKSIQIHWDQDFEFEYPELHQKMQFV